MLHIFFFCIFPHIFHIFLIFPKLSSNTGIGGIGINPVNDAAVFVLHGGSEAYRVNVCVMNPAEGYKQMMSAKVWSENGAHEVCKFIQRLFYFEGEIEAVV